MEVAPPSGRSSQPLGPMAVVRSRALAPSTWLFPGSALLALSLFLAPAPCRADATVPSVATRRAATAQPTTTTMARHRLAPAVATLGHASAHGGRALADPARLSRPVRQLDRAHGVVLARLASPGQLERGVDGPRAGLRPRRLLQADRRRVRVRRDALHAPVLCAARLPHPPVARSRRGGVDPDGRLAGALRHRLVLHAARARRRVVPGVPAVRARPRSRVVPAAQLAG